MFIANRGEIAQRIIRTAKRMGIETVLGVSAADRDGQNARMADRVVVLGPAPANKSYLDMNLVIHAAISTGCDALHPGYGFLSERPDLARLCDQEGVFFIGPRAETIEAMGDKLSAIAVARQAEVPTVPGTDEIADVERAVEEAKAIGFPLVMKASAGGGGKGMFRASNPEELRRAFARAQREAEAAFGDGRLYMERFVEKARHVEVQVVGDGTGNVIHFGDRDCSVQRRYQKLIEEAPVSVMPADVQDRLRESAVRLCAHMKYRGAGTVEFLYDVKREEFYFIEVNSRIQVEHPVTEEITGYDLIECQISAAIGDGIGVLQKDVSLTGHAIEVRINAEDPNRDFMPAPGRITRWDPPTGDHVRLDTFVGAGDLIPPFYDSMVGKLIVHGTNRDDAIEKMLAAIDDFDLEGLTTTLPIAARIIGHPEFRSNDISTRWLEDRFLAEPQNQGT
jgi:acetyl-CoA carboxylase biotin carboxylase subunit